MFYLLADMQIHVRLAEPFWRIIDQRDITVEVERGATLLELMIELRKRFPALAQEMDTTPPTIILGDDEADLNVQLQDDMLLHFVWPIAGG